MRAQFLNDIYRIASGLVECWALPFDKKTLGTDASLFRWLDFAMRHICPRPRAVSYAAGFHKRVPPETKQALGCMVHKFRSGSNVNPFQPKGWLRHNNTSNPKKTRRTDRLWADWGIHHLHLSMQRDSRDDYFYGRADHLLFCMVTDEDVRMIDIRRHDQPHLFADASLIEAMLDSWTDLAQKFRLKGVLPPSESIESKEIDSLRSVGITPILWFRGAAYVGPGGGLTTAATAVKVTMAANQIKKAIFAIADAIVLMPGRLAQTGTMNEFGGLCIRLNHKSGHLELVDVTACQAARALSELSPAIALNASLVEATLAPHWLLNTP